MIKAPAITPEERKMLNKAYYFSLGTNMASSKVSQQSKCFAMAMYPGIDMFYDDPEDKKKAFYRHAGEFFNTHQVFLGLLVGIALAMEKQQASHPEEDITDTISTLKASLMGPTAGIGDSFFFNCFRVIIAGLCIGIASSGNILGVLLFVLLYGGTLLVVKYLFLTAGYRYGTSIISEAFKTGVIPLITEAAGILGAIMVGVLVAQNVKINIILVPTFGDATVNIQGMLDTIMPGLLSLVLWGWAFAKTQKGWSPTKLIFVIMGGCIVLAFFGIL
ncbi:MAG: PTS system mannose/fructose/sorbose family transporter subunit IID [Erysipelotrichaceae bacterium]